MSANCPLLIALLLLTVANNAFGRRLTFKLRAVGLTDFDTPSNDPRRYPNSDAYAVVYVNNKLLKEVGRNADYTWNTNDVDWEDVFSISVQPGDTIKVDVREFNAGGYERDTWHGSVSVGTEDLEHVGPHKYPIIDKANGGLQSGTLFLDLHAIRLNDEAPCA